MKNELDKKILTGLEKTMQIERFLSWEIAKEHKLSPMQIDLIYFISSNQLETNSVSILAKEFNLKKSTVSDSINNLIKKGMIKKVKNEDDARGFFLKLTDSGKKKLEIIKNNQNTFLNIINEIPVKDQKTVHAFFMKLISSFYKKGYIKSAKICLTCNNFKKKGKKKFCSYLGEELKDIDLKYNCRAYLN